MEIIIKETYQKGKDDDGGIYEIFDYDSSEFQNCKFYLKNEIIDILAKKLKKSKKEIQNQKKLINSIFEDKLNLYIKSFISDEAYSIINDLLRPPKYISSFDCFGRIKIEKNKIYKEINYNRSVNITFNQGAKWVANYRTNQKSKTGQDPFIFGDRSKIEFIENILINKIKNVKIKFIDKNKKRKTYQLFFKKSDFFKKNDEKYVPITKYFLTKNK